MIDNETMPLDINSVSGIISRGGTILGTSRTNPCKNEKDVKRVIDNYKLLDLTALIVVGGDDTLGAALKLSKENLNLESLTDRIGLHQDDISESLNNLVDNKILTDLNANIYYDAERKNWKV